MAKPEYVERRHNPGGWERCDKCGKAVRPSTLVDVQAARQTHWSPAEYERWSTACCARDDGRDAAYERAAARYDGEGKDWR